MSSDKFDRRILELTNEERAKAGLDSLSIDIQLDLAADLHTDEMLQAGYMSHQLPGEAILGERISATGYDWATASENIALNSYEPEEAAEYVVEEWMNSPGHRANILNSEFTHLGVGYGNDSDSEALDNYSLDDSSGKNYFTQVFAAENVDI